MTVTTGLTVASERAPIEKLAINTIRTLSMDAVQAANSGHPGTPMAMAPVAYSSGSTSSASTRTTRSGPTATASSCRPGHASMLLYSLLHLTGVKAVNTKYETLGEPSVPLDDIKKFRQLDSKCPGHPEYRWTSGVETTTGPLGQGVATSVGMAIAGKWLAGHFNRPGFELFDFDVYALCGDGCMMEGISGEAASLAGHLKLVQPLLDLRQQPDHHRGPHRPGLQRGRRHALHRPTAGTSPASATPTTSRCSTGPSRRLQGHQRPADADHRRQPHRLRRARQAGHHAAHGEPLGEEEIRLTKRNYGWPEDAKFLVPDGVYEHFQDGIGKRGKELRDAWFAKFEEYKAKYPELADQLDRMQHRAAARRLGQGPADLPGRRQGHGRRAIASAKVLNALAKNVPWLIGGSADLAPSTKTRLTFEGAGDFEAEQLRRPQPPLRHPRARHGRDPQRHGAVQGPALRLGLPDLQRLRPRPRSAWRRSWRSRSSTSSRTTRSASARTARRTSRSSSWPRCGPSPA